MVPVDQCGDCLDEAEKRIEALRGFLRGTQRTVLETDRMHARNHLLRAKWAWRQNRPTDAIDSILKAENRYMEVVNRQPQNRTVRIELAQTLRLSSQYYADRRVGDPRRARDQINKSILNRVHLLENDAKDVGLRLPIIEDLLIYGDLSTQISDHEGALRGYRTALADCDLIQGDERIIDWSRRVRIHAAGLAYQILCKQDQDVGKAKSFAEKVINTYQLYGVTNGQTYTEGTLAQETTMDRPASLYTEPVDFLLLKAPTDNW